MTVLELVDRERARLRRMHMIVGLALAVGATCLLLAARRIGTRQRAVDGAPTARSVPGLARSSLAANVAVVIWTARRLERRTTRSTRRRGDRARAVDARRVARAACWRSPIPARSGVAPLRRSASELEPGGHHVSRRSSSALVRRGAAQAAGAATVAVAALAFAVPNYNDGLLAILQPVQRVAGHAAAAHRLRRIFRPPCCAAKRCGCRSPRRVAARSRCRSASRARRGRRRSCRVDRRTGIATIEVGPLRGDLTIVATDGRSVSDTGARARDRPSVRRRGLDARDLSRVPRPPRRRACRRRTGARAAGNRHRGRGPRVDRRCATFDWRARGDTIRASA